MSEKQYDVVIIGAGPAGIQAAIHSARKKTSVLLLGRIERSSLYKAHVENYACVSGVKTGKELLEIGLSQIKKFGAEHMQDDVLNISTSESNFKIELEIGVIVNCLSLIFATGTSRKKLKVVGEKELSGRGVSYCVDCDANFYRNATVAVVGNESAAIDGALTLLGYASKVYLITKKLNVSDDLVEKLNNSDVECLKNTWVKEIIGENAVTSILLEEKKVLDVDGVFIELGAKGAMELAVEIDVQLDLETMTHIQVNSLMETNIKGVYAAGDIVGHPYQMAKAVGEGCIAGMESAKYCRKMKKKIQAG